jgi:hypothetical protein
MKKRLFITLLFLGGVLLQVKAQKDTTKVHKGRIPLPVINLSEEELDEEEESQDMSGILQASKDIFVSTAGYTFGKARFKIRGLQSEFTTVMINGMPVNDVETGRPYWSIWGGLNDVMRDKEIAVGIVANPYAASNLGGYTNITARASKYRKGTKLVYSSANRSYRNRAMITHSTGMLNNGFALTISASRRWANEGYVEGTFYDAYSYFLAVEKQFSEKHSLNLVVFNAPKRAGSPGHSIQEAYDLSGTNYYNPNWGWQDGKKRNARISNYNQPKLILTDYFHFNEKTKLSTSLMFSHAKSVRTKLSWLGRTDPRPDYYRNMPYFGEYDSLHYEDNIYKWENTGGQLNWDLFYNTNWRSSSEFAGEDGNKLKRALYMIEEEHNDYNELIFHNTITHTVNEHITLHGGMHVVYHNAAHYKVVNDLLGADFWLDIDKFAKVELRDNDIRNPEFKAKVGDRFGYDYNSITNEQSLYAMANFTYSKFDFFVSTDINNHTHYRIGNMQNGKFPDRSLGASAKFSRMGYSLLGGLTYKLSGRHFLSANASLFSRAPKFREIFSSPRVRNDIVGDENTSFVDISKNEIIKSLDVNYIVRYPRFKSRLTYYYTDFQNSIKQRYMYLDFDGNFVNFFMTGIDKVHTGIELAAEYEVLTGLTLYGVLAKGIQVFQNRPEVNIIVDAASDFSITNHEVQISGYHLGQGPETVASLGLKYWAPTYWFAGVNVNYMDDIYLSIAETRYIPEAIVNNPEYLADPNTPHYEEVAKEVSEILRQKTGTNQAYTVDVFAGKSWRIKHKYYINLSLNVSNVLDNQNIVTGGYDQYRFDAKHPEKFKKKLFYLYGRQYFLNVSFRF